MVFIYQVYNLNLIKMKAMKNLLLIILLISFKSFTQSNYTITKDAIIYDLAGGEFLTAKLINSKTHLKHYDVLGEVIWEDSIAFQGLNGLIKFNSISQFLGTNNFVISMINDLTPDYSNIYFNDTLIYQFTKLDLANHQFTNSVVDTFYTKGDFMLNFSDTSIYLFVSDRTNSNAGYLNYSTYSLNQDLETTLVAPHDSMVSFNGGVNKFLKVDDQIVLYQIQYTIAQNLMKRYSTDISLISYNYFNSITNNSTFDSPYYTRHWNDDSLFVFTQGTTSGSNVVQWRMDWRDLVLSPINSTTFLTPFTNYPSPSYSTYYSTNTNRVAIDKINKKIMILTVENGNLEDEIDQKIFVYDFEFNLICVIPISIGTKTTNLLQELNEKVYLKVKNPTETVLYEMSCLFNNISEVIDDEITIYPNPTNEKITIKNATLGTTISIFDTTGKLVYTSVMDNESKTIEVSTFDEGIYFVHTNNEGITSSEKLIVTK